MDVGVVRNPDFQHAAVDLGVGVPVADRQHFRQNPHLRENQDHPQRLVVHRITPADENPSGRLPDDQLIAFQQIQRLADHRGVDFELLPQIADAVQLAADRIIAGSDTTGQNIVQLPGQRNGDVFFQNVHH